MLRRTQTVRRTVEEVYLRDDIACGSALCSKCAHLESDPALPPPLCADATHFAVPDARALSENVEAFLAAAVPGEGDVVLLASELRAAHARGDARLSRALRVHRGPAARGSPAVSDGLPRPAWWSERPSERPAPDAVVARVAAGRTRAPASAAGVAARAHAVLRAASWYAAHVARKGAYRWWWSPTTKLPSCGRPYGVSVVLRRRVRSRRSAGLARARRARARRPPAGRRRRSARGGAPTMFSRARPPPRCAPTRTPLRA